jgi:hypothetical protein
MIRSLNLVVTESEDGSLAVNHLGRDRAAALEAFRQASVAAGAKIVCHYYQPAPAKRKYPGKVRDHAARRLAAEPEPKPKRGRKPSS